MNLIQLENIEKYYNKEKASQVHALKSVTLEINKGERVALMGVSGSGKSSLLHILGLLDHFDGGRYCFDGADVRAMKAHKQAVMRNEKIGFVMQHFGLIHYQTALQNVSLPLLLNSHTKYSEVKKRSLDLLGEMGLSEKALVPIHQLSGGQQQRVAIARAMANNPLLLLADEPTGMLDAGTAGEIMRIFRTLNEKTGMTIVLATHDPKVAAECTRVIHIEDGVIR